jgi:hypothetical protein
MPPMRLISVVAQAVLPLDRAVEALVLRAGRVDDGSEPHVGQEVGDRAARAHALGFLLCREGAALLFGVHGAIL